MYEDPNELHPDTFFQGDIITDFPFFIFDNLQPIKKVSDNRFETDDEAEDQETQLFAVEAKLSKVILLSQSCDLQRRNNIMICPLYDVATLVADGTLTNKRVEALRAKKINYWFYLPSSENVIDEAIADLQRIQYIPKKTLDLYIDKKITSLNDLGRHQLGWFLANYFGRPIENN